MKKETGYVVSLIGVILDVFTSIMTAIVLISYGINFVAFLIVALSGLLVFAIVNYKKREWVIVLLVLSLIGLVNSLLNESIPYSAIIILVGTIVTLTKKEN